MLDKKGVKCFKQESNSMGSKVEINDHVDKINTSSGEHLFTHHVPDVVQSLNRVRELLETSDM